MERWKGEKVGMTMKGELSHDRSLYNTTIVLSLLVRQNIVPSSDEVSIRQVSPGVVMY